MQSGALKYLWFWDTTMSDLNDHSFFLVGGGGGEAGLFFFFGGGSFHPSNPLDTTLYAVIKWGDPKLAAEKLCFFFCNCFILLLYIGMLLRYCQNYRVCSKWIVCSPAVFSYCLQLICTTIFSVQVIFLFLSYVQRWERFCVRKLTAHTVTNL